MKKNPLEPTASDLDQVVDEARKSLGLGPAPRTPTQGVKDMQARVRELSALRRKVLDQIDKVSKARQRHSLYETLREIKQQLTEAHMRKREYQTLLHSQN